MSEDKARNFLNQNVFLGLLFGFILLVASIVLFVYLMASERTFTANHEHIYWFAGIFSGTFGTLVAAVAAILFAKSLEQINESNKLLAASATASNRAVTENTKAFQLNEYRYAIKAITDQILQKNKSVKVWQPEGNDKNPLYNINIEVKTNFWDLFHGSLSALYPGIDIERVIVAQAGWADLFDKLDDEDKSDLISFGKLLARQRALIKEYIHLGGNPSIYLDDIENSEYSVKYLNKPCKFYNPPPFLDRLPHVFCSVYTASIDLVETIDRLTE
ncbi:hypothetical protein [Aliidiomarina sanyensis]|uniref:Phage abortive infection protein n=1 Tax=Aliidiomarina sanyensis TaxID=1249555 RepID=A0A432WPM2_9GAMM|nr:hypothetical protein [Aliidiomarina sanyensis]RUO35711.1 hypothetical protein CWE11_02830 [Aliidiomarina sanyensis]